MSHPVAGYPILLTSLDRVQVVVIGGGAVGERKVAGLLHAHANICLISPQATARLQEWAAQGRIRWMKRNYLPGDLNDAWLVIVATNQRQVNAQAAQEARQRGILCNVVDAPTEGNFHVPATYYSDEAIIAVSTLAPRREGSVGDPARAVALRDRVAAWLERDRSA